MIAVIRYSFVIGAILVFFAGDSSSVWTWDWYCEFIISALPQLGFTETGDPQGLFHLVHPLNLITPEVKGITATGKNSVHFNHH